MRLFRPRQDTPSATLAAPAGGFVDVHSHVIPDVDDGAKSWEESMAMLRQAAQHGTSVIVATPHGDSRARWTAPAELQTACRRLNAALKDEAVPLIVVLGMENPLEPGIVERLKSGAALPMGASNYVLVEFPYTELPLYWEEALFQLQLSGRRPIIAHPERQSQIQEKLSLLEGVVSRGVLVQITAGSLTARFGSKVRKTAEAMAKHGLAHVVASDAHGPEGARVPDLLEGYAATIQLVGQEQAVRMMAHLPRLIALGGGPKTAPVSSGLA